MKWISVEERLPEYSKRILLCNRAQNMKIVVGYRAYTHKYGEHYKIACCHEQDKGYISPTHWMPLPDLPLTEPVDV